ncbi:VOC family protein [Mycolicibacterium llatzerense]|uniref:Lactoylglutathione lyase n=1 Tax=Mycolicibacterium llatzerense TaxID=280871 RepID=A0A0D1JMV9_9MYCO|nr:VOC family protein [Mycolicibacterium llatzerense]KIU13914.1 lactoylglutathione lyase [Mycolicibacterium llatzerense]
MPNIENLRKQAKLYVRWHRSGYYPVAAQIRAMLPRYGHLTDDQVLRAPFKLSDALEVVARQSGFDSWQALKTGVQKLTGTAKDPASSVTLQMSEPQLFVTDVAASCAFFTSKLGFTVEFSYGEPPFYGQVKRDNAILNLRHVDEPVFVGDIREREQLLSASITLDSAGELRELFLEYQNAGVIFHQTLKLQPWGARTLIVRDPDGNLLLFSAPADTA